VETIVVKDLVTVRRQIVVLRQIYVKRVAAQEKKNVIWENVAFLKNSV
jgi:hypothetical protein